MPPRRSWPDELPEVFLGSDLVAQAVLTSAQLRDQRLRRLFTDVYSPRHVPPDHRLDCRGAALVLPAAARLTGRSLATVLGTPLRAAGDDVEVVVPTAAAAGTSRRPGARSLPRAAGNCHVARGPRHHP